MSKVIAHAIARDIAIVSARYDVVITDYLAGA